METSCKLYVDDGKKYANRTISSFESSGSSTSSSFLTGDFLFLLFFWTDFTVDSIFFDYIQTLSIAFKCVDKLNRFIYNIKKRLPFLSTFLGAGFFTSPV